MRPGVNFTAFDAVKDDFHALRLVSRTILAVVIKPEAENNQKASPQIEQKKNVYFQSYHRE